MGIYIFKVCIRKEKRLNSNSNSNRIRNYKKNNRINPKAGRKKEIKNIKVESAESET